MKTLLAGLAAVAVLLLAGCDALNNYDRSYSVQYANGDQSVSAGVTLHPRTLPSGFKK